MLIYRKTTKPLFFHDLVALCGELDLPDFESVGQEIATDAVTWKDLPQKFSSLLGACPKTEAA